MVQVMDSRRKAEKLQGALGFDFFYSTLFSGRWPILREALLKPAVYARLCMGGEPYFLDPGSVCAALCLPLSGAFSVLDMCAAPGGKTLVLASCLEHGATLVSNERSAVRRNRLSSVIKNVLPSMVQEHVALRGYNGALWCRHEQKCFDRIMLDAPCSSERHVLGDGNFISQWSPARVKSLAMEQWALLSSSWRLLVPGGFLLYATCALSYAENDGVVERLLKKNDDAACCSRCVLGDAFFKNHDLFVSRYGSLPSDPPVAAVFGKAEQTRYGLHILPDTAFGAGPLYFSLIQKTTQA